jgi:subtilisin family serine protease
MKYLRPNRYVSLFIFIILSAFMISIAFLGGSVRAADLVAQEIVQEKVEPLVLKEITSSGSTDFFVWMKEKADLRPAHSLLTKKAKGQFVYRTLRDTANRTQNGVRAQLNRLGVDYRSFYIANKILVRDGDMTLVNLLAARPDVSRITANHLFQLQEPFVDSNPPAQVAGVESNISFIKAPDVWALGYKGAGIVLAGNDTGLDWDHPAIKNQYRGWNGSTVDHNYNWWDATGTYLSVPDDGHGHGTHTTGTMVGDDGNGNQIGVAPGAKTIHCKNMTDSGSGSDATFTECFEFDLAPWDLTGNNPDPDKAPDAVNNSWGYWGGDNPQFEGIISTLQAAGILVEVSAGNEGPSCQTLRSPGDYGQVLTTGSVNHAGGSLPGTITDFSSRGPSDLYPGDFLPDIMAPGESIRSSLPGGNNYASWSGTSMAGPHVTALVGLMWNASPRAFGWASLELRWRLHRRPQQ